MQKFKKKYVKILLLGFLNKITFYIVFFYAKIFFSLQNVFFFYSTEVRPNFAIINSRNTITRFLLNIFLRNTDHQHFVNVFLINNCQLYCQTKKRIHFYDDDEAVCDFTLKCVFLCMDVCITVIFILLLVLLLLFILIFYIHTTHIHLHTSTYIYP